MSEAKPEPPWDFLTKPPHVVYLEKVSAQLWKYALAQPAIDMPDASALWEYLIERKLIGVEIVTVPDCEVPAVEVNKYFVTREGRDLIDVYRKQDPKLRRFRSRWR